MNERISGRNRQDRRRRRRGGSGRCQPCSRGQGGMEMPSERSIKGKGLEGATRGVGRARLTRKALLRGCGVVRSLGLVPQGYVSARIDQDRTFPSQTGSGCVDAWLRMLVPSLGIMGRDGMNRIAHAAVIARLSIHPAHRSRPPCRRRKAGVEWIRSTVDHTDDIERRQKDFEFAEAMRT